MKYRSNFIVGLFLSLCVGCGGSPLLTIDVDLGANQSSNTMKEVQALISSGQSSGIYILFEPLNCVSGTGPKSLADTSGAAISSPDSSQAGSAVKSSYEVETSKLSKTTYYKVSMVAADTTTRAFTHVGVGDCPINLALSNSNRTTICFGRNDSANPPLCPGATPFSQCPGVATGQCF